MGRRARGEPGRGGRTRKRAPAWLAGILVLAGTAAFADSEFFGADAVSMRLFRLDPRTGAATLVGALDRENVRAIAAHPRTGALYGVDTFTDVVLRIDPTSGASTVVSTLRATHDPFIGSLAFDPTDVSLHGVDYATSQVVHIDAETGQMTAEAELDTRVGEHASLAIDAAGRWFIADTATDLLRRRDGPGEPWITVGPTTPLGHVTGLAFDPDSGALHAVDSNARSVARIDPRDARTTLAPTHGVSFITGLAIRTSTAH